MRLTSGLKISGIQTFGNSMYPLLVNKDIVYYRRIPFAKIQVDDLIGFIRNKHIINHRVIYKENRYLITKGDYNTEPDSKVLPANIIGKILYVIREKRTVFPENIYLAQSNYYFKAITQLAKYFHKNKIPYVYLKGLPVYLFYTKTPPRRIYADSDILISPHDREKVHTLLLTLGYFKQNNSLNFFLEKITDNKAEVTYSKVIKNFVISFDIHFQAVFLLTQTKNLDPIYPSSFVNRLSRQLLSERKIIPLKGVNLQILTPENQILYLALHIFHDNFKGYYKYSLLEKVINRSIFNEEFLIQRIREFRLENFLYPVFFFLNKYYSPKLSKKFLKKIEPKPGLEVGNLTSLINIFEEDDRIGSGINRFKNIYFLSPRNHFLKPLIFFKLEIISLVIFALLKKTQLLLINLSWKTLSK